MINRRVHRSLDGIKICTTFEEFSIVATSPEMNHKVSEKERICGKDARKINFNFVRLISYCSRQSI